jgi:hypothetical protein
MRRTPLASLMLVVVLVTACTGTRRAPHGPVPVVENPPTVALVRMQSVAHWHALAGRLVERIRGSLGRGCYPETCRIPISLDVPADSPFALALGASMRTAFAATGDPVAQGGPPEHVRVRVQIQTLRFGPDRVARWRPESSGETFADEVRYEGGRSPRLEVIVIATVTRGRDVTARVQEIAFARHEDASLYEADPGSLSDVLGRHEQRRLHGGMRRLSDDLTVSGWGD